MKHGTKFEVVKSGVIDPLKDGSGARFKAGEIWDLVPSGVGSGPVLRKLKSKGGSIRLLNGHAFALCGVDAGRRLSAWLPER